MKCRVLILVAALVASSVLACAQTVSVDIGFPFTAGGKDFAAGKYTLEINPTGPVISLRGTAGATILAAFTFLGRHDNDPDLELVFDKVGGKLGLSEIWYPGRDGYLVLMTKEAHEHVVVRSSTKK
jgi:hypothetical protein